MSYAPPIVPAPRIAEPETVFGSPTPAAYAAALAARYADTASEHRRRELGQFFTHLDVAQFMAQLAKPTTSTHRLLDPGAGAGILACALCEGIPADTGPVHLDAYEIDPILAQLCDQSLSYARDWLSHRGVALSFTVHRSDFVLEEASVLDPRLSLFAGHPTQPKRYDLVITNPPYFKLQKQDPRALAAASVVHGQPNIYALFLAVAASLLVDRGVLVSITPRSFSTGDYFRRFRQTFFATVTPEVVHLFHSRKDAFRADDVLQENVILRLRRARPRPAASVTVSTSAGVRDLAKRETRRVPVSAVIDSASSDAIFHIPIDDTDDSAVEFVRRWPNTLHRLGLEVSTGPVVAFRATQFLRTEANHDAVPLLWLRHIRAMDICWPLDTCRKPQYIVDSEESRYLLLPKTNYVVLRRFTAKEDARRLTASPLLAQQIPGGMVGLENHLNYVYRPRGTLETREALGLAALFNSALIDRYFRVSNGHTQVNAVELRALPLPSRDALLELGAAVERGATTDEAITSTLQQLLKVPKHLLYAEN